jgi:hypothetical protein
MDAGDLAVGDGDRAVATGRLVRDERGDWFEPPVWIAEPGRAGDSERRIRPVSKSAVKVAGADFDTVAGRFEKDGVVEGWATVTGTWSGGQLRAGRQAPPAPRPPQGLALWVTPPCPPPGGGWPAGDLSTAEVAGDITDLTVSGAAVSVTWFRPAENLMVLVVAAADPALVEARLRPRLGGSLCVVPSRWSKAQLNDVRGQLDQRWEQWEISSHGASSTADGQACVLVRLVRVLPEIAVWAGGLPPGIVDLQPWLSPAREGRSTS